MKVGWRQEWNELTHTAHNITHTADNIHRLQDDTYLVSFHLPSISVFTVGALHVSYPHNVEVYLLLGFYYWLLYADLLYVKCYTIL